MRPCAVRAFSTTQRIAQQQLFEPYVPGLNERQKKALRKAAQRHEPNYHGNINKDATQVLTAYTRSQSQRTLLTETLKRVRNIVREHAGPSCDVKDIGMHTYSRHIHDSPFEFAIVDKSRPDGVSPDEDLTKLPVVYDASRLSEILTKEGFTGGFWAPPWDMGRFHGTFISGKLFPPTERDLTIPWPRYRRPLLREFHYPVRIVTYSPVTFSLTLPGPSVMRLHQLIQSYFRFRESLDPLMAMLFVWTRSHRMDEFTPQCLALMVIRYMQEIDKVPNLMDLDYPVFKDPRWSQRIKSRTESKMWIPFQSQIPRPNGVGVGRRECHVELTQLEHTIVTFKKFATYQMKPGSLLWDFLHFWRNGSAISKTFALSVGQNKYLKRQMSPLKDRSYDEELAHIFETTEQEAMADGFDPTLTKYDPRWQSFSWRLQALIVQDPFVPTYNHAESVSRETMHSLIRHAQIASRQLARAAPFTTAFGDYFISEKAAVFRKRKGFSRNVREYHANAAGTNNGNCPENIELPKPVLAARVKTVSRVQRVIRQKYGGQYTVQLFGSTEYGVSSAKSDLDLVVIDSARMEGFPPQVNLTGLPDIYNVKKLSRVLQKARFTNIQAVEGASVPIVKFRDPRTGLHCDINVNEQLGRLNTGMIKRYCDIVPVLRSMVAFIKRWAKPLGLNNPSAKSSAPTFSSYALMLMTISYLQSRGLAPNLQGGLGPGGGVHGGCFWKRKVGKYGHASRIRCDTRYHLGHGWAAAAKVNYEDALTGWFQYWGDEHSYSTSAASIRQGGFVLKSPELQNTPMPTPQIFAEEPKHYGVVDVSQQSAQERDGPSESSVTCQSLRSVQHAAGEGAEQITQKLVGDRPASNEPALFDTDHPSDAGNAPDGVMNYTHDSLDDQISKSFDKIPQRHLSGKIAESSPQSPSSTQRQSKGWLRHPLCVVDPFIRTKVVTQAISNQMLILFRANCRRAARLLSRGASLEDVVGKPKGKKVSKKLPKIPDAPVAGSQKRSPPAASVMQKNDVHFDSTPTMIHAVFTPQTTQQYPGAVASGADEHASAVLEADQVFINNEDIWEAEETDLVDTIPRSPRRTLAEFEPEGFGLKMQYLKRATSYVDEPPQGSVELEVSGINDKASHTEEQSTAGLFSHIGTGSVVSGGQHAADQADQEIGESYDQNKSG